VHEYGIAAELVEAVDQSVRSHQGRRASKVVVGVSPGAVEEQSLRSAFDEAKRNTCASEAQLVLEVAPQDVYCLDCEERFVVGAFESESSLATRARTCTNCGGTAVLALNLPGVVLRSVEIEV